jgi:hypothetical protein
VTIVIPFPGRHRVGHAQKVATMLKGSRSEREAFHILSRAADTFQRQMTAAGVPIACVAPETRSYLVAIGLECQRQGAKWMPILSPTSGSSPAAEGG